MPTRDDGHSSSASGREDSARTGILCQARAAGTQLADDCGAGATRGFA
jgi:hypothetical protein